MPAARAQRAALYRRERSSPDSGAATSAAADQVPAARVQRTSHKCARPSPESGAAVSAPHALRQGASRKRARPSPEPVAAASAPRKPKRQPLRLAAAADTTLADSPDSAKPPAAAPSVASQAFLCLQDLAATAAPAALLSASNETGYSHVYQRWDTRAPTATPAFYARTPRIDGQQRVLGPFSSASAAAQALASDVASRRPAEPTLAREHLGVRLHLSMRASSGYKNVFAVGHLGFRAIYQENRDGRRNVSLGYFPTAVGAAHAYALHLQSLL